MRNADFNHGAQKNRGLGTVWRWGARAGALPAGAGAYPGQDPPPGCNIHPRHGARGVGRRRAAETSRDFGVLRFGHLAMFSRVRALGSQSCIHAPPASLLGAIDNP